MQIQNCKKCNKEIIFLKTKKGSFMPVDADSLSDSDLIGISVNEPVEYRHGEHISHFATCPNATDFRSKKK